jgi:hypothetical protein
MNEDGHVSIPRRGYFAAGLAVAMAGSIGAFALTAGADEVATPPAAPAAAEAQVDPDAPATYAQTGPDASSPPPVLPWGETPTEVEDGPAGASSKALAATGADIAQKPGPRTLQPEFSPKGYTSKKRSLRHGRTRVPPQPPVPGRAAVPATRDVNYHYASTYQYAESDGSYANMVIWNPKLGEEDYHTLAEIAVQTKEGDQTVEVGWTVDRGVNNGSEEPHLFVYHWVDGKASCYNACGFRQYSKTVFPGDKLPTGVAKRFGIQFFNDAWWVAYDSEWIGYFPADLWKKNPFTRTGLVQWFGEVATSSEKPCSEMGTGVAADDAEKGEEGAGRFGTISLLNSPDAVSVEMFSQSPGFAPTKGIYPTVVAKSKRTSRYGGPGAC